MFDALAPYSFIILLTLWLGWYLFGRRRSEPKPLSDNYRTAVLRSLHLFRDCGLLKDDEVDEPAFLEMARHRAESDGEPAEVAGLLASYALAHGPFENFQYHSLDPEPSVEEQIAAAIEAHPPLSGGGEVVALTFEGSYWDGGFVLAQMTEAGIARLSQSLDPEEAQLRRL